MKKKNCNTTACVGSERYIRPKGPASKTYRGTWSAYTPLLSLLAPGNQNRIVRGYPCCNKSHISSSCPYSRSTSILAGFFGNVERNTLIEGRQCGETCLCADPEQCVSDKRKFYFLCYFPIEYRHKRILRLANITPSVIE